MGQQSATIGAVLAVVGLATMGSIGFAHAAPAGNLKGGWDLKSSKREMAPPNSVPNACETDGSDYALVLAKLQSAPDNAADGNGLTSRLKVWQLMQGQDASNARTAPADPALVTACDAAQSAMNRINQDPAALAKLGEAIAQDDIGGIQQSLHSAGLTDAVIPGAQFHAVNTKGTGAAQGRLAATNWTVVAQLRYKPSGPVKHKPAGFITLIRQ